MTDHITIEERLEIFALKGFTGGFTLKLWPCKAKSLEKQGIILRQQKPTSRKGEYTYEIDFSMPIPNTLSEELYNIAIKHQKHTK